MTNRYFSRRSALFGSAALVAATTLPIGPARAAWKDQQRYVDVGDGLNMAYGHLEELGVCRSMMARTRLSPAPTLPRPGFSGISPAPTVLILLFGVEY